jgi:hypothetical protein
MPSTHPPSMRTIVVSKAALEAQMHEVSTILTVFRTAAFAEHDALQIVRGLCDNTIGVESVTPLSNGNHRVVFRRNDGTIFELNEP